MRRRRIRIDCRKRRGEREHRALKVNVITLSISVDL
jgi:hypothetical protein